MQHIFSIIPAQIFFVPVYARTLIFKWFCTSLFSLVPSVPRVVDNSLSHMLASLGQLHEHDIRIPYAICKADCGKFDLTKMRNFTQPPATPLTSPTSCYRRHSKWCYSYIAHREDVWRKRILPFARTRLPQHTPTDWIGLTLWCTYIYMQFKCATMCAARKGSICHSILLCGRYGKSLANVIILKPRHGTIYGSQVTQPRFVICGAHHIRAIHRGNEEMWRLGAPSIWWIVAAAYLYFGSAILRAENKDALGGMCLCGLCALKNSGIQ